MGHQEADTTAAEMASGGEGRSRFLWLLGLGLAVLVLYGLTGWTGERRDAAPGDFELRIVAEKDTYVVGEVPVIDVALINRSGKTALLCKGYAGRSFGFPERYPILRMDIVPSSGLQVTACGGGVPIIRSSDFISVVDGKTMDPRPAYPLFDAWDFRTPGTYRIQMTYDTTGELESWKGFEPVRGVASELWMFARREYCVPKIRKVPRMKLVSNEITITMQEADDARAMWAGAAGLTGLSQ